MNEELNYFSVSVKKIDGTENDYEMISSLNPCFSILPKDKLELIENIAFNVIEEIKVILKSNNTVEPY